MTARTCEQCDKDFVCDDLATLQSWCSQECYNAWDKANPGDWIAVEDLNARQRAELDVLIGNHASTA